MAYFALLWKARTIEKYRQQYEEEKINSIMMSKTSIPKQTLTQRWRLYRYDTQKRISRTFRRWYPEGSSLSNLFLYMRTDQTFPNFVIKSILGFVGGIVLTYLCFMFFVFQLSISMMHATIMSSIIGVLLTLGLAFSYRIRCLVFLLIPQFFSRVGRYTLTCYALVLILTGPATNTLKNSEVLSESMACSQEQIKTSVSHIKTLMDRPLNSLKYSVQTMAEKLKEIASKMKTVILKINRLVLSLSQVIYTSYLWLSSLAANCNAKLGPPYLRCLHSIREGVNYCKNTYGDSSLCDAENVLRDTCSDEKIGFMTKFFEHLNANPVPVIKKRLKNFTECIKHMFFLQIHVHHSYSFSSNTTRTASQVAAGIVTEIRKRADPLLTWLSWSSYVTSFFLLLIIFRAKNYQHMFETRSRYDNRYITKDIRVLDLKRLRERRETILPLNRREQEKYVTTTSFRLVASEKAYLNRSIVFMAITTFKLMIHMIADYSLYWVLMTIRHHGRLQTPVQLGSPDTGIHVSGSGFTADLVKSIVVSLGVLLESPVISPVSCLPNPSHPDFKRYTQIGVLIFLLWFFSMFEPYGLRLRHVVMGHYQPERAKTRAVWLYNHILRARAGFMKLARRKLHRTYKYRSGEHLTIHRWLLNHIPFGWLRAFLGIVPMEPHCLLCGTVYIKTKPDTQLTRCKSLNCPGIYCDSCFTDIGELCTICLSPEDYGDLSDVSLEKGSSDDSDESDNDSEFSKLSVIPNLSICAAKETPRRFPKGYRRNIFSRNKKGSEDIPLISKKNNESDDSESLNNNTAGYIFKSTMKKALLVRYKHNSENLNEFLKFKNSNNFDNRKVCDLIRMSLKTIHYAKVEIDIRDSSFFHQYRKEMTCCLNKNENLLFRVKNTTNKRKNIRSKTTKYPKNLLTSRYSKLSFKSFNSRLKFSQCRCYRITFSIDKTVKNNRLVTAIKNHRKPTIKCKMKRKRKFLANSLKKSEKITTKFCLKNIKFSNSILNISRTYDHGKAATLQSNGDEKKKSKTTNGKDTTEEINKTKSSSCYGFEKLVLLFSEYWKHIIPTKNIETQTSNNRKINDTIVCKEKKNHKHRRKKTYESDLPTKITSDGAPVKSDDLRNEENRNYRLTAFLSDQDWIKRQWVNIGSKVKTDLSVAWNDISEAVAEMTSFPSRKKANDTEIRSEKEITNIAYKLKEEIHRTMNNEIRNQGITITETSNKGNDAGITITETNNKGNDAGITITETNNNANDVCEKQIACELITAYSSNPSMEKIMKFFRNFFEREKRLAATCETPCLEGPTNCGNCEEFREPITNSDGIVRRLTAQVYEPSVINDVTINNVPKPCEPCTDNSEENRVVTPSKSRPNIRSAKIISSTFFKKLRECWKPRRKDSSLTDKIAGECACFRGRSNESICCTPAPKKKVVGSKGKFSGKAKQKVSPPPESRKPALLVKEGQPANNEAQSTCPKDDTCWFSEKKKDVIECRCPQTTQDLDCENDQNNMGDLDGKDDQVNMGTDRCYCTIKCLREVFTNTDENYNKEVCDAITNTDAVCDKNGDCKACSMHNVLTIDNVSIDSVKEDSANCIVCTCTNQNNQTGYKQKDIFKYLSSGISSETFSSSRSETVITNQSICYPVALEIRTKFRPRRRIERDDKYAQTIESIGKRHACTNTRDWWSPIVERKELRTSYPQNRRRNEERKEKTLVAKMRLRTDKANETEKNVTFRSSAQIIPSEDILSPYRYLLQSQKYYNELFATKNYPAPLTNPFQQRYIIGHHQTSRQSFGSRQHSRKNYKTKRLVECYSPKKQVDLTPSRSYPPPASLKRSKNTTPVRRVIENVHLPQYNVKKPPVYEWVRGEEWTNARKKFHRSSFKSSNQSK